MQSYEIPENDKGLDAATPDLCDALPYFLQDRAEGTQAAPNQL